MSNYISEYESEVKQYINLSEYAWSIINNDIEAYSIYSGKEESLSGFLNKIIEKFYAKSKATISQRIYEKESLYNKLIKNEDPTTRKGMEALKEAILLNYQKELINDNLSYPAGQAKKFRINIKNTETLRNLDDDIEKAGYSLGKYLKIIFEEYSRLTSSKREEVICSDIIDQINIAKTKGCGIKVILYPKTETDSQNEEITIRRKFKVRPYSIVPDNEENHMYLIGISREITNEKLCNEGIYPFRLTNIERVIPLSTESDFISKEKIAYLEKACKKPQYFNKQDIEITVKFTDKGVNLLRTITKDRPTLLKKNSKYEYVFKGNDFQLKNYFWKYGPEVEVLSPIKIRKLFINNIVKLQEIYKDKEN